MVTPARTIADLLALQANRYGERAAIRSPSRDALTYGELLVTMRRSEATLRELGIGSCDRVAMVLPNGPEMAVAFLAVASAATAAPLNPAYKEGEIAFACRDLGVKAMLVGSDPIPAALEAAERLSLPVIEVGAERDAPAGLISLRADSSRRSGHGADSAGARLAPSSSDSRSDDVALVLHTSGTTARPKIVPLTQRNLCVSAGNIERALALTCDDVCLNVMPLFHIHGLMAALLASLSAGASVLCTSGFRAAEWRAWLHDSRPTWYTAVPTIHQAVVDASAGESSLVDTRLRFVRSSSSALPARVLHEIEARFGVPVIEAYGMTEASHQMASNPLASGARKVGSVGHAAGPEIAVMHESGRLLERGAIGELVVRGETITSGYEANPEANAFAFIDGWFRTGDQGYVDAEGYVFLTGRLKELINRGGEKIAPREVEEALLRHRAVAQAVAFAVPHARLGEEVGAAVVLREGASATRADLRRTAGDQLAYFKVPRRIEIVAEIPKGATGKVQRAGLARALGLLDPAREKRADEPPRTPLALRIATVWARLLDLGDAASLDVEDDFFESGGDSLAAVEMIEAMSELLGVDVPIADFLERPTIAGLLDLREQSLATGASSGGDVVPIRAGGRALPIFCTTLHDGSLWRACKLARFLPGDIPVYGLPAPPVAARGPLPSIEDLAARNLEAIARIQPDGPVRLLGPCFGGTVALEMAIRLERSARPVELLAMVNSFNRAWRSTTSHSHQVASRGRHLVDRVRLHGERLAGLRRGQQIAYLRSRADLMRSHWRDEVQRLLFEVVSASGMPRPQSLQRVAYASRRAQRLYRPGSYAGSVLMVRATAPIAGVYPLPYLGWADSLRGRVELLDLPCEQLELWNDDGMLRRVAARIGEVLAQRSRSAA